MIAVFGELSDAGLDKRRVLWHYVTVDGEWLSIVGRWECGGTAYAADLKSVAERLEGSNPSTPTNWDTA